MAIVLPTWCTIPVNTAPHSTNSGGTCAPSTVQASFGLDFFGIDWAVEKTKQEKVTRGNTEGYECEECQDFYPMAELNQPDGTKTFYTFKCYGCRNGLSTLFKKLDNGE